MCIIVVLVDANVNIVVVVVAVITSVVVAAIAVVVVVTVGTDRSGPLLFPRTTWSTFNDFISLIALEIAIVTFFNFTFKECRRIEEIDFNLL